jgi:hypothetical protein
MYKYSRKQVNFGLMDAVKGGFNTAKNLGGKAMVGLNAMMMPMMIAPMFIPDATTRAQMKMQKQQQELAKKGITSVATVQNNQILPPDLPPNSLS